MEPRLMLAASLVQDLNTTPLSSTLYTLGHLGNVAIFAQNDGVHGVEPYRSDGTKTGTFLLHDIIAGANDSNPKFVASVGNTMYFSVTTGASGTLWKTDG